MARGKRSGTKRHHLPEVKRDVHWLKNVPRDQKDDAHWPNRRPLGNDNEHVPKELAQQESPAFAQAWHRDMGDISVKDIFNGIVTFFSQEYVIKTLSVAIWTGLLVVACVLSGFKYTPWPDLLVYCCIHAAWVAYCLPWLIINLNEKTSRLLMGVTLRLFGAEAAMMTWNHFRGHRDVFQRALRLRPMFEPRLGWLSEVGYCLRFGITAACTLNMLHGFAETAFYSIQRKLQDLHARYQSDQIDIRHGKLRETPQFREISPFRNDSDNSNHFWDNTSSTWDEEVQNKIRMDPRDARDFGGCDSLSPRKSHDVSMKQRLEGYDYDDGRNSLRKQPPRYSEHHVFQHDEFGDRAQYRDNVHFQSDAGFRDYRRVKDPSSTLARDRCTAGEPLQACEARGEYGCLDQEDDESYSNVFNSGGDVEMSGMYDWRSSATDRKLAVNSRRTGPRETETDNPDNHPAMNSDSQTRRKATTQSRKHVKREPMSSRLGNAPSDATKSKRHRKTPLDNPPWDRSLRSKKIEKYQREQLPSGTTKSKDNTQFEEDYSTDATITERDLYRAAGNTPRVAGINDKLSPKAAKRTKSKPGKTLLSPIKPRPNDGYTDQKRSNDDTYKNDIIKRSVSKAKSSPRKKTSSFAKRSGGILEDVAEDEAIARKLEKQMRKMLRNDHHHHDNSHDSVECTADTMPRPKTDGKVQHKQMRQMSRNGKKRSQSRFGGTHGRPNKAHNTGHAQTPPPGSPSERS